MKKENMFEGYKLSVKKKPIKKLQKNKTEPISSVNTPEVKFIVDHF